MDVGCRPRTTRLIGRATRLCPQIKKDSCRIFDAVDRNTLPGLVAAMQRPRELTRKEFKKAARQLDAAGFTDANLRRAYRCARNADIAASIFSSRSSIHWTAPGAILDACTLN